MQLFLFFCSINQKFLVNSVNGSQYFYCWYKKYKNHYVQEVRVGVRVP